MSDQEFNFPPAERREPKQFEPPPWERDAFEQLEQAKQAEAEDAARAAAEQAAREAEAAEAARAAEATRAAESESAENAAPAPAVVAATPAEASAEDGESNGPDEAQLTEMMAGLRAEEPTSMQSYGAIAIALSVFTGLVGVVMLIWAMAMFVSANARGTGRVGTVSGSIVAFFGALFIGLSVWVAVRTLRQRGVL